MNFTRKSRQSTVKHEVKSKFRRFANNFCRKNTGFLVDFHFFDSKRTNKHVYFTVLRRPKRREHDKTHGFERKKLQIRTDSVESASDATAFAANPGETSAQCAKVERHTLRKRKGSFYGFVCGICPPNCTDGAGLMHHAPVVSAKAAI